MTQDTEQETLDAYRAEVDRLHAIIAERDEQGRQRTAEGLRERNRADAAESEATRVHREVWAATVDAARMGYDGKTVVEMVRAVLRDDAGVSR